MPKMSREQFDHICEVLKKKKIPLTQENIVKYMLKHSKQKSKFFKPIYKEIEEKANQEREKWAYYLSTIKFRIKLFGYHFIFHKKGFKGRLGRFDIIEAKSIANGDRNLL